MGRLRLDISMSLDGYVAGPNAGPGNGLGDGGEQLHEWALGLKAFREPHGMPGGEITEDSKVLEESQANVGATVMGRGMFGGGGGPWEGRARGDEPWEGWWGEEPPFHMPVFVLTHHEREPLVKGDTTFTFVTDGTGSALEQAQVAAGDKDVALGGGADVARQYLAAGLLDEMQLHLVPVMLADGVRLFDGLEPGEVEFETTRVLESPTGVTHLRYRVVS